MKISVTVQGEGGTLFGSAPARAAIEIKLSDGNTADEVDRMVPTLAAAAISLTAALGVEPIDRPVSDGDDGSVGQTGEGADKGSPEIGPDEPPREEQPEPYPTDDGDDL